MILQLAVLPLLWLRPGPAAGVTDQPPCRPATQCLAARQLGGLHTERWCTLEDGSQGVRCRTDAPRQQRRLGLAGLAPLAASTPDVRLELAPDVNRRVAQQAGVSALERLRQVNEQLQASGGQPAHDSPSQLFVWNSPSTTHAQRMGYSALQHIETMKEMQAESRRGRRRRQVEPSQSATPSDLLGWNSPFSPEEQAIGKNALQMLLRVMNRGGSRDTNQLTRVRFRRQAEEHKVPGCTVEPEPSCDPAAPYRTASGECNNLQQPLLGRSLTKFQRLLPNTYEDEVFAPRRLGKRNQPLPNARFASQRTMDTTSKEAADHTISVMQWGQLIDHDITQAPIFRLDSGEGIECCNANGASLPRSPRHPLCIPVSVPASDPFYSRHGLSCMNMVRSLPAPEPDCVARPATQLNAPTHYLDASMLYGSTDERTAELRSFVDGRMLTSPGGMLPDKGTLPTGRSLFGGCPHATRHRAARQAGEPPDGRCRAGVCFKAGDERVNEQGGLAAIHTIFLRLHNHIAGKLKLNHRSWDDEKLFQGTRRVLIAMWQHVIYNEWLPMVIGHEFARRHGLLPLLHGYSSLYSPDVDPRSAIEFSTAAYRFGHSMVRDVYTLIGADGSVTRTVNVTETFFEPSLLRTDGMASIARMLTTMRSERFDMNIAPALHEQLFSAGQDHGFDLIAFNIQRGREHGIPTYASMLSACTGLPVSDFADLLNVMEQKNIARLMAVYEDVHDVDLFVGGLAEKTAEGALVGPTFQCIIAQQFFGYRYGDRFYYDNGGMAHSFTLRQLQELRKASWAGMLCDTLGRKYQDDFDKVQPLAFFMPSSINQVQSCTSAGISRVDLSVF